MWQMISFDKPVALGTTGMEILGPVSCFVIFVFDTHQSLWGEQVGLSVCPTH